MELADYLGTDALKIEYNGISTQVCPPFERVVLEEDEESEIYIDEWGRKARRFKKTETMPEWLEFPVKNARDLEAILEERFKPTLDGRFPPDLKERIERYRISNRSEVVPVDGGCYYGTLRNLAGVEVTSYLFYDAPALVHRLFNRIADLCIMAMEELFPKVEVDYTGFGEDIAFKSGPLISPAMFEEFLMPCYKRTVDFARAHGQEVFIIDSDGDIRQLIPLYLECGISTFLPMEVISGQDVLECRKTFGKEARFIGGIDKRQLAKGKEAIERELKKKVPPLIKEGGYIPMLDHMTISADISLENYVYYFRTLQAIYGGKTSS